MTPAQNDLITLSAKGTPLGALLRRYWQPIALLEELEGPRPAKAVKVLGQDMVLFRDEQGRLGLLDRDCPHRGADLAFGRLEDGGLRCLFHGWLFDVDGNCIQTPGEPAGSSLCSRVKQRSYPVVERAGMIFGFLGEGDAPAFPGLDCFAAPDSHVFAFKGYLDCNWLQALEVGVDPAHASFLHRFFEDEEADAYGKQFRGRSADSDLTMIQVLREFENPDITITKTDIGFRLTALRSLPEGKTHVRITNLFFPQAFVIPLSETMTITQWHVPIDDHSCYWYAAFTSFTDAVDKEEMRRQRLTLYELPDYKPRLNRQNDYGYDVVEQRSRTYTGMGEDINVHDQWAVESMGRIQDRTREHLGTTDKGIVAYRTMLIREIGKLQKGERPLLDLTAEEAQQVRDPGTVDGVAPAGADLEAYWREVDRRRRDAAPWASQPTPVSAE
ncbi:MULTISPECIES: aromatic ring-hydroxylating dioxygenase subunit alpha [Sphingobium]|uniref:aromatic ring-hydroxylating dioxygenase subunit alpha n=1 Tax=Sphingobium TaxID=165695 RepID=UPI0015EBBAC2|nr:MULTISPECIES: aromatic ring-hydroxylating dioxygenase subunit alpha [Sphingobium]MCW2363791.1 phenylpropionate dioxygenase-like ring-hydroxylating dioxygenase large terminal subunit [Sphingobium sp. B10D3B]MCW2402811.1 phenylpropionate dioxygenase-like ring-hydroxylating dioxygenase large terminal subunit [Sphingobium sp. B10D7B]MCW2409789.1 phenylpropionate dioxygenase-like ring-hydroxylating dioxygenase large terminal subunit [Sphingobium xanthum]